MKSSTSLWGAKGLFPISLLPPKGARRTVEGLWSLRAPWRILGIVRKKVPCRVCLSLGHTLAPHRGDWLSYLLSYRSGFISLVCMCVCVCIVAVVPGFSEQGHSPQQGGSLLIHPVMWSSF